MIRIPCRLASNWLGSSTYWWVLTSHTYVLPHTAGGITPVVAAVIPLAATRNACRRWGVAAYGCFVELGARGLVARSSAPGGVVVAAGEPGAVPIAPKLLKTSVWKTALTVCRSELRPCESGSGGLVLSPHAATRAAKARPNQVRRCVGITAPAEGLPGRALSPVPGLADGVPD